MTCATRARLDPLGDFAPAGRVVVEHAGDLVKRNAGAVEDVGDFRHRAGRAVGQPLAGHPRAIAQPVERARNRSPAAGERLRMITGTLARRTTGSTVDDRA